jgi:hypothetical protein
LEQLLVSALDRDDQPLNRLIFFLYLSSAARACMRAGISSENSSSRRSGMAYASISATRAMQAKRSASSASAVR